MALTKIEDSELFYTDYSDTVVGDDDPSKKKKDADLFNKKEKYEVVNMINSIPWKNDNSSLKSLLIVEWMLHEKLPSDTRGRANVRSWVIEKFSSLKEHYPRK